MATRNVLNVLGSPFDKILIRNPTFTRFIIGGHSYAQEPALVGDVLGMFNTAVGTVSATGNTFPERNWTRLIKDSLGLDDLSIYLTAVSVAQAATRESAMVVPYECFIQSVVYIPTGTITGANTDTRRLSLILPNKFGGPTVARIQFNLGTSATAWAQKLIANNTVIGGTPFVDAAGAGISWGNLHLEPGTVLRWQSLVVGAGIADPGGMVVVKVASEYWNMAIGGSLLCKDGLYQGGWATVYAASPYHRPPGVPVAMRVTAAAAATSLLVDALLAPIPSGSILPFSNGVTATTTAVANPLDTTITVSAISSGIPVGETAYHKIGTVGGYNSQAGIGSVWCFNWGVNEDAGQREGWRQSIRAMTAWALCSTRHPVTASTLVNHWQYVAGNGAGAAWASVVPASPVADGLGGYKEFTGAVGAVKPTATLKIPPAFEGGTIVIAMISKPGANQGFAGTITVDGAAAPDGPCTFDTSIGYGGTSVLGVPMVKQLTGLAAGAHTILVTLDSSGGGASPVFRLHWHGIMGTAPVTAGRWLNVARVPSNAMSDANVALFNADIAAVLAGSAIPPTINSPEAGFDPSAVKVVDIDTPLAKSVLNFDGVGTHPNDRGHVRIASAVDRSLALDTRDMAALAR